MQIITKSEAIELGLIKFFTGKPCNQGHISERYVNKGACVRCNEICRKKYNAENKEHISNLHRNWVKKNHEKANKLKTDWAKKNPDKVKETMRKHYLRKKINKALVLAVNTQDYSVIHIPINADTVLQESLDMKINFINDLSAPIEKVRLTKDAQVKEICNG